jgi:hypothetical protein
MTLAGQKEKEAFLFIMASLRYLEGVRHTSFQATDRVGYVNRLLLEGCGLACTHRFLISACFSWDGWRGAWGVAVERSRSVLLNKKWLGPSKACFYPAGKNICPDLCLDSSSTIHLRVFGQTKKCAGGS